MSSADTQLSLSAEITAAEAHDAAGRHAEAIDQLVAGVKQGDVEATTRLGKRLLVGDRAPLLPNDGARFLEDASGRGGAEAASMLAVLFAVGASPRHDLRSALDSLVVAAERGWEPAQDQLRVLAADRAAAELGADEKPKFWRELGSRVDLGRWTSAPPGQDLSGSPRIRLFDGLLSPEVCRWLIGRAAGRLSRALVYEALSKEVTVHPTRTNTAAVFSMLDTDLVCVLTQLRMAACLGVPFRQFEPITVLHYADGEEITEHYDFVDPNVPDYELEIAQRGQRIATFLLYLNDDYGGGETEFPRVGASHKGRTAQGLYFINSLPDGSADVRTLHAGRPPKGGEKWIVSQFVRNRRVF
jgi:prolyl 4-hydroxylase